jgi:uncharacterized membrane protein
MCEICGRRTARYVCQECGREVCEACLEPHMWVCSECYGRARREAPSLKAVSWSTPLKLFLLGFLLIFMGMIFVTIATVLSGTPADFGAVVFVGPIPIVLGAGPHSLWAIALAVAITILGVILFLVLRKRA